MAGTWLQIIWRNYFCVVVAFFNLHIFWKFAKHGGFFYELWWHEKTLTGDRLILYPNFFPKKNNRPFSTYFDILLTPLQLHQVVSNRTKSFKFNITETLIKLLFSTKRRGIIITKLEASLGFVTWQLYGCAVPQKTFPIYISKSTHWSALEV